MCKLGIKILYICVLDCIQVTNSCSLVFSSDFLDFVFYELGIESRAGHCHKVLLLLQDAVSLGYMHTQW